MTWMKHENEDELDLWWIGPCESDSSQQWNGIIYTEMMNCITLTMDMNEIFQMHEIHNTNELIDHVDETTCECALWHK